MAVVIDSSLNGKSRKTHSLKIDMTPMVDLGFLLITFFIFTTTLAEPKITKLIMPADGEPVDVPDSKALTVLLDKDKAFVYNGQWEKAVATNAVLQTDYNVTSGLGAVIRKKQKELDKIGKKDELVFIIKALPTSSYQNVVTALDEVLINDVSRYALVEASKEEKAFLQP